MCFGGFGTDGSRFVRGSILGSGGGDGEWSGVIGVVGILSDNNGFLTSGGESSRSLNNKLVNYLIDFCHVGLVIFFHTFDWFIG